MPRNDQIQSAMIDKLKLNTTITSELPAGATEVRGYQWQGTTFTYPNVRVRMISNVENSRNCDVSEITLSIQVFSEEPTPLECDRISGIIRSELHDKSFTQNDIHIYLRSTNLIPAIRSQVRTWRSEVMMDGLASEVL